MFTIAKYSFKEMFNKRALILVLLLTVAYLLLYGFGIREVYSHRDTKSVYFMLMVTQLISVGLYFANFIITFLVAMSTVGALSGDIESGAMQAVLVKPIKRHEVVMGKFIGISAMISIYSTLFFTAIIGLNKIFGATIKFPEANLIEGALLFILGPLVLLSVALWGSSRFSTLNTGILVVMLYGFAMVGGMIEQFGSMMKTAGQSAQGLINAGIISSLIMPTDVIFRKMNSVLSTTSVIKITPDGPFGATSEPSIWMMVYIGIYILTILYTAAGTFTRRDI